MTDRTDRTELQLREAEIEAELQSRKTTSQLQSEALRGKRPPQSGNPSHRQANALRRGGDDE